METKHTSLPWAPEDRTNKGGGFSIIATDVHYSGAGVAHYMRESDARRILACVTACEGIADPSAVPELLESLATFIKYHDEEMPPSCNTDAMWANARAAIAKATGNTH